MPTTPNADYGIQLTGFDDNTHDVTDPIGTVIFNNVQVDGSYDKAAIGIQGYTISMDLTLRIPAAAERSSTVTTAGVKGFT